MPMKTKRPLILTSYYWALEVPAGADVVFVKGDGGGYALRDPRLYGLNDHGATYRYVWVRAEDMEGRAP